MSIKNKSQISEAEQIKKPDSLREGLPPEKQKELDRIDKALKLGSDLIKRWLKDKKGVEFSKEQEEEFDKLYSVSFAFCSMTM